MKGFGTVVTGTLISGAVREGAGGRALPAGRRLRVRGVQVHGSTAEPAPSPASAPRVNLADIEPSEIARGDVLAAPGRFHAVRHLDCRLDLLPSARPLKHRAPVHFHSGTAEIEAEVRLLGGVAALQPGAHAYARIVLRDPALLLPGDRFIIRMFSPVVTIGGGVVVDIGERRYRKSDNAAARLDVLAGADIAARLALLIRESAFRHEPRRISSRAPAFARTRSRTAPLRRCPAASGTSTPLGINRRAIASCARVRDFHAAHPLLPGIAKQDLRARELPAAPPFLLDALLADAKDLVVEGETVRSSRRTK